MVKIIYQINYEAYSNKLVGIMRKAERAYYTDEFKINKDNSSRSWNILKKIIRESTQRNSNILLNLNDAIGTDTLSVADHFNNFFTTIGESLSNNINNDIENDPLSYLKSNLKSMTILEFSENEIINIIMSLNNSSPGYDELPAKILKKSMEGFIKPITYLINKSLESGVFPKELKLAKVIPIFKSGSTQD